MNLLRVIALILISLCFGTNTISAQRVSLLVKCSDATLPPTIKYNDVFLDVKQRENALRKLHGELLSAGYLEASLDSTEKDSTALIANFHLGRMYQWAQLKPGTVDEEILSSIGFRDKLYHNKALRPTQMRDLFAKVLGYCEQNGYPFASIALDSLDLQAEGLHAVLDLDKSHFITIDSIHLVGNPNVAAIYVYNYLGIKPGMPYNETLIRNISTRIKEIPFLSESKPSEVIFTPKSAGIYLYLDDKKASKFNGILGVLPNNETGEITITGDAKLRLKNALGRGELIDFNWRKLQTLTQDLKVQFTYPFLLNTPFGIDLNFKLYKRDTTFLELNRNLGVQYILKGGDYFKVFIHNQQSSLLSPELLLNQTTLPSYADVNTTTYGAGIQKVRLDYRLNPRSGYSLDLTGGVGNKTIKENAELLLENPNIYEGVKLRSTQYQVDGKAEVYIPLKNRSTIKLGVKGGSIVNENTFLNEMYRVGGIRTLRGFDEESIIASAFAVSTLEYRFLLEQNSNFYVFFDQGWYENSTPENFTTDTPFGFGAGISFETKAGIFSVNYALGSQFDNPILVRAAKIHFGFVSVF